MRACAGGTIGRRCVAELTKLDAPGLSIVEGRADESQRTKTRLPSEQNDYPDRQFEADGPSESTESAIEVLFDGLSAVPVCAQCRFRGLALGSSGYRDRFHFNRRCDGRLLLDGRRLIGFRLSRGG